MQDFSVCVSFSLFLSFLISILYVNVKKKRVYGTSVAKVCIKYIWSFVFMFEAENNSVLFKTILCPFKFSTTPSF